MLANLYAIGCCGSSEIDPCGICMKLGWGLGRPRPCRELLVGRVAGSLITVVRTAY
jgi:hypothetical protein